VHRLSLVHSGTRSPRGRLHRSSVEA
jgi:hypothetical protein